VNGVIACAPSSLVAIGASGIGRVEEDQRITGEVFERGFDDVPRAREPGVSDEPNKKAGAALRP